MKQSRGWLTLLRYLVSGGLLIYLIWRANPATILAAWQGVNVPLLLVALGVQCTGVAISCWKWGGLLRAAGYDLPYSWLIRAYLVGQFASNFLPTAVGGDAVRIVIAGRRIGSYSQASATIFLERITGFIALSLIANIALLLAATDLLGARLVNRADLALAAALFGMAGVVAGGAALASPRLLDLFGKRLPARVQRPLQAVAEALGAFANRPGAVVRAILVSFLYHTAWIGSHVLCGLALGLAAPPLIYALMVPITDIVGLIPIFVNNLGARELVFSLYLAQVGIGEGSALALSFLVFTVRLVLSSLGGLILLMGGAEMRVVGVTSDQ
jgi:glycosyltransferase 2 family protein